MQLISFRDISLHDAVDTILALASLISTAVIWLKKTVRVGETLRMEAIADKKASMVKAESKADTAKIIAALDEHEVKDAGREAKTDRQSEILSSKIDRIEEVRRKDHAQNQDRLDVLDRENRDKLDRLAKIDARVETLMSWFSEWREMMFKKP